MLSAIFVSYRSAPLALAAIGSLRREARDLDEPVEVIAVVTSQDPSESDSLLPAVDQVILATRNLGFAGGLNAGIDAASGDLFLLANPDLLFLPGSVAELLNVVRGVERVAAGPAFFWDREATLFQPPAEEPRPFELARRRLGRTTEGAGRLFRRDLRRALSAREVASRGRRLDVTSLRGALVATNRATLDAVGPFDEGYRLYYEENDWQRRLRSLQGRLVYAGGARVVHIYNQSARTESGAPGWFAESERRYFLSHFGEAGRQALEAPDGTGGSALRRLRLLNGATLDLAGSAAQRPLLIALSPSPAFRPIILAEWPAHATEWRPPVEVRQAMPGTRWFARAFDSATLETVAEGELSLAG